MEHNVEKAIAGIMASYERFPEICKSTTGENINKEIVVDILGSIRRVLFPGFFNLNKIQPGYMKYVVGEELEFIQYNLQKQISRSLGTEEKCDGCPRSENIDRAEQITRSFIEQIPQIREMLSYDVQAAFEGDPAAKSPSEIIITYPGFFAITIYRVAHQLHLLGVPMLPRVMTEYAHSLTGIDIHPGATIGEYFFIDHGTGIVIGETTEIGDHVKIYQGVTLGALSTRKGQELKNSKRHPTINDNVTIYSGATILGGNTVIGEGATIGGNAFIVTSIPAKAKINVETTPLYGERK